MCGAVADGRSAGLGALEMPVGAVQSPGVAAREAGRGPEHVRGAACANVQASEESVANRNHLRVSRGWVRADLARLETSCAERPPLGTGGVPVEAHGAGA